MEQEISQCEERLLKAFKDSDIAVLEELIHERLIFNAPNGEIVTKEMDLDSYRSGDASVETIYSSERKIQIFEDTAVVSTIINLKGDFMEMYIDGKARFLRIWKKFGNQWKVIGGSSITLG